MYALNVCHLYPDLLNLYGDRGNVIIIKKRCEWRGININITPVSIGDRFDSENFDILFIGGGQDYEQEILQPDLLNQKANEIKNYIMNGKVALAICGGYQILGDYYKAQSGKEMKFLGALNIWTLAGKKRMIGNLIFECDFLGEQGRKIVGFENHSGMTFLGEGIKPLGRVIKGYGNNGQDHFEGAIYKNTFCTYSHGCLLSKNPALADHLISLALKAKYKDFDRLQPLDDSFEISVHDKAIRRQCT